MRILAIVLVALGILALAVPSITFFTTERAVDAGFFKIDYQKPHTILLNPIVGIAALVAGIAMLFAGRKTAAVSITSIPVSGARASTDREPGLPQTHATGAGTSWGCPRRSSLRPLVFTQDAPDYAALSDEWHLQVHKP